MNIKRIEQNDPGDVFYNLRDKLSNHIIKRSEEAFNKATKLREQITTKQQLEEYTEKMRSFFIESIGGIPYDKNIPLNAKIGLNNHC